MLLRLHFATMNGVPVPALDVADEDLVHLYPSHALEHGIPVRAHYLEPFSGLAGQLHIWILRDPADPASLERLDRVELLS